MESQQELCRLEVEEVQEGPDGQSEASMKLLHYASQANKDTLLEHAMLEAMISRGFGHRWERTEVDDEVKLKQGDRIATALRRTTVATHLWEGWAIILG